MKLRITYRAILLLLTLAVIPAVPLLIISLGVDSAEYVMRGTFELHSHGNRLNFGSTYLELLSRMATFNFGHSVVTGQPATWLVLCGLAESCKVILPAIVVAYIVGTMIGLGIRMNPALGRIVSVGRVVFFVPIVVFAYLMAFTLSYAGISSTSPLRYLIAACALAIFPVYLVIQAASRTVDEVSRSEPFQFHLATGFSNADIWSQFYWRLLAVDYLAFAVHMLVFMFGFLFFVEVPLGIDGMGPRFVSAVYRYDYPVIVGFCSIAVLLIGTIGFCVDLVRSYLDPRKGYI